MGPVKILILNRQGGVVLVLIAEKINEHNFTFRKFLRCYYISSVHSLPERIHIPKRKGFTQMKYICSRMIG